MKRRSKSKKKLSLGGLRPVHKTSARSPDCIGRMTIQRNTLVVLMKQLNQGFSGEVVCNIAGWMNENENGPFLTIQLSPLFAEKVIKLESNSSAIKLKTKPPSAEDLFMTEEEFS